MSEQRQVTFALLILAAPHLDQNLAIGAACGIVASSVLLSDAVCNAARRIWLHLTRQ